MNTGAQQILQQRHPLPGMLSAAVPLWASQCLNEPTIGAVFTRINSHKLADRLWDAGEALIYRVPGKSADGFNALAETIAILAFSPGGIDTFGMHFEYVHGTGFADPKNKHGTPIDKLDRVEPKAAIADLVGNLAKAAKLWEANQ